MKLTNTQANQALLIDAICEIYGIPVEVLNTKMRLREVVNARQMMFKVARDHFGMTYSEIGRVLLPDRKKFDHSTIIYAKRAIDGYIKVKDENTIAKYNAVMDYISSKTDMRPTITISCNKEDVNAILTFLNQFDADYNLNMKYNDKSK
jgi:hypothetical protein